MRMQWIFIVLFIVLATLTVSAWPDLHTFLVQQHAAGFSAAGGYGQADVKFSEVSVKAEVPLSSELDQKGLGGRTSLGATDGMLFIFDQPDRYAFWMKGMLFPLDFIWIDQGQVKDITPDVPAPTLGQTSLPVYQPEHDVTAVLEVNAGFAAANHVSVGDLVSIDRH